MIYAIINEIKAIIRKVDVSKFETIETFDENIFDKDDTVTCVYIEGIKAIVNKKGIAQTCKKLEKSIKKAN